MLLKGDIYLDQSSLSIRAINALRKRGYRSLSECINLNLDDLLKIKNIGKKTANDIFDTINSFKSKYRQYQFHEAKASASLFDKGKHEYWINMLAIPISRINLSIRATHILKKTRALSLLELVQKKPDRILRIRDCGRKTVREITDFLRQLDLQLGERFDEDFIQDVELYRSTKKEDEILSDFKRDYPEKYDMLNKARVNNFDASRIKFYMSCFHAYQEGGTLEYVAKMMHLTRERIRQILTKGTQLGLFSYTGRDYHYVDKSKIIDDFSKYSSLNSVAKANSISSGYLKRMLTAYKITEKDLDIVRNNSEKNKCIEFHRKIAEELGHYPTTTELQNKRGWRYLSMKISRLWGSIDTFREELQIPKPIRKFPEASRRWQENRGRIAFIIRMQNLDQIRDCLTKTSPLSSSEIACECNIKPPKALRLLNLLFARGEIIREGTGSSTKYNFNKKQEVV